MSTLAHFSSRVNARVCYDMGRMVKLFVSNKAVLSNPRGKVLIMRLEGGRWDLPGGRMDAGEGMLEGLARELREETGLDVDVSKARPFHVGLYPYKGDPPEMVASVFYAIPVGDVTVAMSEEHESYEWIDPRQTFPADAHKPTVEVLEAYRKHEGIVVAADPSIKGRQGYGLVQVFTGNGKGKTTAALGEAIRALGAGKKVGIIYFDKGGTTHYNERKILDALAHSPQTTTHTPRYLATGRDRIDPVTNRFDFSIQQIDKDEAARGLAEARKMFAEGYDVVILDEINSTADLGMIDAVEVMKLIEEKPEHTELILTGRNASDAVLDRAHLVTEMRLRKHYFYSGVQAREGLDY